ncbi:uncharacterized protein [Oryza sativa Japonica Group]|uniref:Os02g0130600 protein n=4 Tax=Oryza TaxID=4527 RepID=Q0E489_ORYSJ|nr:uncharacterized protein LOC4328191 [Oryza sativa Japonica Group]XP_052144866.1 uncharacterized protein LOC127764081 [Oryza glaberrima]EEC72415.1 hypothetical protein OsI_05720 [Oryza sativa Indica Group]KAB8085710.1 hypothetical protein EE612_008653 [Oryza sativa]EEE56239.1 hypothetical protein OsJ_05246 [Oryza sativa Japonica Group]KAF2942865.1 hypothetical protein DAI22_02g025400 [Oryza sativa Japonica Group]BAD07742.1 unknown protein [Oryza sativa Japonica Group]|eukprot:NP_001045785.1 Os02g0130600 [Oryza sativa Japonica Group]
MFHGSPAAVAASAAVAEMRFTTGGSSTRSWEPTVTADTSDLHYWMQWRAAVCALSVLACMAVAACLVWRHEGPGAERRPGGASGGGGGSKERRRPGVLYDDEAWRPCLRDIHPAWLLGYRLISFFVLLSLLIVIVISDGGTIFYYYTQWTFILVTIYFGLGTALSIYGCSKLADENVVTERTDMELGSYVAHGAGTKPNLNGEDDTGEIAGFWGYLLQIIYQTNAGAVMLTDCVFWFIIFPFLTVKDYNLNFLLIGMHSVNAVFLLGEAALNSLSFPWFRVAYFFLWTALYVIFQWILHASTPLWWPYPFLDVSANLSPLWYFAVAIMQLPCYAVFRLVIKLKHHLLTRWFPGSVVRGSSTP